MSREDVEHQIPSSRNELFTVVMRVGPLEKYERKEEERHFFLPIERSGKTDILCTDETVERKKKKKSLFP